MKIERIAYSDLARKYLNTYCMRKLRLRLVFNSINETGNQ